MKPASRPTAAIRSVQGTYADGLVATGDGRTCEAKGDGAQITLAQAVASRGGALRGVVLFTVLQKDEPPES